MKEGPIGYKLSRGKGELLTGLWPDLRPYSWPLRSGSGSRSALRHGDPTHRYLRDIPAWQSVLLTGLWHGDPAHKYSSAISAWRRGLLAGLWHSDPTHRYFCGIFAWQDCLEPVSNRSLVDAPAGIRHGHPAHRCLCDILGEPL